MRAMLFAAGLGTRLRPMTNNKPKALVEVAGKTLLEHAIERLIAAGVETIVINVHHFADQILAFLANNKFEVDYIISDERAEVLETGGGLKKAARLLGDQAFIAYNADVISNINLKDMYAKHLASDALATLAVRQRESSRCLLFDQDLRLCGWRHRVQKIDKIKRQVPAMTEWAFSGIHVISPQIFDYMKEVGKFSIIDTYLSLAASQQIQAYPHTSDDWFDVGSVAKWEKAESFFRLNHNF